jgi:hypothetical protein
MVGDVPEQGQAAPYMVGATLAVALLGCGLLGCGRHGRVRVPAGARSVGVRSPWGVRLPAGMLALAVALALPSAPMKDTPAGQPRALLYMIG